MQIVAVEVEVLAAAGAGMNDTDADGPTDPVRPGSEDARYFADDPLFGAVHDDAGYESRFWSDDVASGAGARDRAAMWAKFDADFDARRRAGADAAARPLGVR